MKQNNVEINNAVCKKTFCLRETNITKFYIMCTNYLNFIGVGREGAALYKQIVLVNFNRVFNLLD